MSGYRRILVPYDFSEHARAAVDVAVDLAHRLGSDLDVVHVLHRPVYSFGYSPHAGDTVAVPFELKKVREDAERALLNVVASLDPPGKIGTEVCEETDVATGIRRAAERRDTDLIVMGTHGRTGLAHVFLGSVAERVIRDAPCGVLTVRAGEVDAKAGPGAHAAP